MPRHSLLMILAVALVVWGAVGLYQGLHSGFSGGLYDARERDALRREVHSGHAQTLIGD